MSVSTLFDTNNFQLKCASLNCETINNTKQQFINETNSIGQVLKIKNINPNEVEFQDAVENGLPDTVGYPDGYVLKIIDNLTGEVNWEPDVGGVVVPFVLTGDAVNALQIRNSSLESSIIVDTTTSTVQLQGTTRVEGVDTVNKFGVYNNADTINPEFSVDTLTHQLSIKNKNVNVNSVMEIGGVNKEQKFIVVDSTQDKKFIISTDPTSIPIPELGQPIPIYSMIQSNTPTSSFIGSLIKNGATKVYVLASDTEAGGVIFDGDKMVISNINPSGGIAITANVRVKLENNAADGFAATIGETTVSNNSSGIVSLKSATTGFLCAKLTLRQKDQLLPNTEFGVFEFTTQPFTGINKFDIVMGSTRTSLQTDRVLRIETQQNLDMFSAGAELNATTGVLNLLGDTINISAEGASPDIIVSGNTQLLGTTTVPTGSIFTIIDEPLVNTSAANKLYVDTHVRVLSNITSYYNEIPGNGTGPSLVSPMVQVTWTQPVWTSAVFVNGTPLNFTAPTAGSVQYTGTKTRWFNITLNVCAETSDPDQEVQLVMLDNSNVIIANTYNCFYTSTINKSGGICCSFQRQLVLNNIVKFAFRTPRQATNMTFMGYRIQITEC